MEWKRGASAPFFFGFRSSNGAPLNWWARFFGTLQSEMNVRLVSLFAAVLLAAPALFAETAQDREKRLQGRLVAACCWSEPISIHRSDAAVEMRAMLHSQIEAGLSDRAILDGFVAQYGERVLIEPEGAAGVAAYAFPILAGVVGLSAVILLLRRWTRSTQTA